MAASSVSLDLMSFVEIHILPRYNEMEGGGNLAFILQTMTRCVTLANAVGADMFPHTPHVENVVLLERR